MFFSQNHFFSLAEFMPLARALIYVILGYFIARLLSRGIIHFYQKHKNAKYGLLIQKIIFYIVFLIFFISGLRELGFDLKVLLGATGILTVAIGFASQTSASNFISGLFLLGENTLKVGDTISVNNITGTILSVDLFSLKLKQADHTLIRIPNEVLLKSPVTNLSHFRERRIEFYFLVSPETNITELRKIILEALGEEIFCVKDPMPRVDICEITPQGIKIQVYAWAKQKNYTEMKYALPEKIMNVLVKHNIPLVNDISKIELINYK